LPVRIRLKKVGAKNRDAWRVVVSEVKMPRDGRFIEEIGFYDPLHKEEVITFKEDRLEYWISKGAQPSETVKSLVKRARKQAKKKAEEKK